MFQKLREARQYILVVALAAFIIALIINSESTLAFCTAALDVLLAIASRFLIGFAFAYGLDFLVSFLQNRWKWKRGLAITLSYAVFLGLIVFALACIVPMITDSAAQLLPLIGSVPSALGMAERWLCGVFEDMGEETTRFVTEAVQGITGKLVEALRGMLDISLLESIVRNSARTMLNLFFGLVISLYALLEKESILSNGKRFLYALLPCQKAKAFLELCRKSNRVFSRFLIGKLFDSMIVGLVSAAAYFLLRVPQAGFFAVVAAVTNMIPYFGPAIGASITVFILLFYGVPAALTALAVIIVIQTIDGWYLEPKILSDAVGLSPLLTIVSITLGGDLAGFWGIILGVPAMAVLKTTLYDRVLGNLLQKRRVEAAETGGTATACIYDILGPKSPADKPERREKAANKKHKHRKKP